MLCMYAFINVILNVSINIPIYVNDFIIRVLFMYVHSDSIQLSRYMEIAEVL